MVIRIIFIILIITFILLIVKSNKQISDALSKIGFFIFGIFFILSIIVPSLTGTVANFIGISKDTDLIFYLLSTILLVSIFKNYLYRRRMEKKIGKLTSEIVLLKEKIK